MKCSMKKDYDNKESWVKLDNTKRTPITQEKKPRRKQKKEVKQPKLGRKRKLKVVGQRKVEKVRQVFEKYKEGDLGRYIRD